MPLGTSGTREYQDRSALWSKKYHGSDFVKYIPQIEGFNKSHLVLAHSPSATNWQGHECDWRCRNYSLQSCTEICGVIVLVNAAVVSLHNPLFQWLTGPVIRDSMYLQRPSQHSIYLRRVLMSWFAEGCIEIDYVLPSVDWNSNNRDKSDHTFCSRSQNGTNSSGKLKLSSKLKDTPVTFESPSPNKQTLKKSSSSSLSEENSSSPSSLESSLPESSPCSLSPTGSDKTPLSQLSEKNPALKCKPAGDGVTVSSALSPKCPPQGSSRLPPKKKEICLGRQRNASPTIPPLINLRDFLKILQLD